MPIMQISIIPLGTPTPSIGDYIALILKHLKENHIKYHLSPMGTTIEGTIEEILNTAKRIHELPFSEGAKRVLTTISIDDRRDKAVTMEEKVLSIERRLG
ncbi:MAG: MTH1187 family thiamine-binding protein [bacterium]|nr:MTH1187 family thiamine-binding protein [bacterium]